MAKYHIQAYSRDMKELLWTKDEEFELAGDALLEACSLAFRDRIISLWIRNEKDPSRLRLMAKFY